MSSSVVESSVVFNLRQLMELEEERVAAERAAELTVQREREARAQAELARREQAERALAIAAVARERAQIEREAVLLRTRLDAERAERVQADEVTAQHARELAASRRVRAWWTLGAVAAFVMAAAEWRVVNEAREQVSTADAGRHAAARLAEARAHEVADLRGRVAALGELRRPADKAVPQLTAAPARALMRTSRSSAASRKPVSRSRESAEELPLDEDSMDPISGLDAHRH